MLKLEDLVGVGGGGGRGVMDDPTLSLFLGGVGAKADDCVISGV